MFLIAGVNHAYETTIGQLIGVVGLKELRKAIEDVNHQSHTQDEPVASNANGIEDGIVEEFDEKNDNGVTVRSFNSMAASSILSIENETKCSQLCGGCIPNREINP